MQTSSAGTPFTVGQLNVHNLFPPGDNSGGEEPTPADYRIKLDKLALTITGALGTPDVVTMQEVGNKQSLTDLIETTELGKLGYKPVFLPSNDRRNINVGLLYREANGVAFEGARNLTPDAPEGLPRAGGQVDLTKLFARPPLAVDFRVTGAAQAVQGVQNLATGSSGGKAAEPESHHVELVVNHLMSKLGGKGEPRRNAQGAWLGAYVDEQKAADPKQGVILIGDFNSDYGEVAYENMAKHADGKPRMYDAPELKLKPKDRYTYEFHGKPSMLDHVLVTPELKPAVADVKIPHFNTGDWDPTTKSLKHAKDPTVPDGVSDHDPIVTTFDLSKVGAKG